MNWNIRSELSKDRAVSPVIGVILMVAITVILAAVVGAFVMGTSNETQATPQASLEFDYTGTGSDIVITHNGGQALAEGNLKVVASTNAVTTGFPTGDDEVTAGESITATPDSGSWNSGETVRLVWTGQNGDSSILAEFEVP